MIKIPIITNWIMRIKRNNQRINGLQERFLKSIVIHTLHSESFDELEKFYNDFKVSEEYFYKIFKEAVHENIIDCSQMLIRGLIEFWKKHNLNFEILEIFYRKYLCDEWYTFINDIEDDCFWEWMFSNGMNCFNLPYILRSSDVQFEDIILKIASSDKSTDSVFNSHLDEFLDSVWEAALDMHELLIDKAISTILYSFPDYEVRVLNHAYYSVFASLGFDENATEVFLYIIERMADYEYYTGKKLFTIGETAIPNNDDGQVNIYSDLANLIERISWDTKLKDIVWILENRFDIDENDVRNCIYDSFLEICATETFSMIVNGSNYHYPPVLPIMMQFAEGYRVFILMLEDILKKTQAKDFMLLEEEYGIYMQCEMKS